MNWNWLRIQIELNLYSIELEELAEIELSLDSIEPELN